MAQSFKDMIRDGSIKRADAMKVKLDDIHEEPGFNLRDYNAPDFEQGIDELADYILGGGIVPPLEVRVRAEGGVYLVDGHRRTRAYRKARERGAPIEWISVVPFNGNDVDRVARVITSQEGRKLTPLEIAAGYKKLRAFGKDNADIARLVNKTRQHVEQALKLADANSDVQQLVATGKVAASVAVDAVRKHGEQAGAKLKDDVKKAEASGKAKVTRGSVATKIGWYAVIPVAGEYLGYEDRKSRDFTEQDVGAAITGGPYFGPIPPAPVK